MSDRDVCPICGGRRFTWGKIVTQGGMTVGLDTDGFWKRDFTGRKTRARCCDFCGNIQLFIETPDAPLPPEKPKRTEWE